MSITRRTFLKLTGATPAVSLAYSPVLNMVLEVPPLESKPEFIFGYGSYRLSFVGEATVLFTDELAIPTPSVAVALSLSTIKFIALKSPRQLEFTVATPNQTKHEWFLKWLSDFKVEKAAYLSCKDEGITRIEDLQCWDAVSTFNTTLQQMETRLTLAFTTFW